MGYRGWPYRLQRITETEVRAVIPLATRVADMSPAAAHTAGDRAEAGTPHLAMEARLVVITLPLLLPPAGRRTVVPLRRMRPSDLGIRRQ